MNPVAPVTRARAAIGQAYPRTSRRRRATGHPTLTPSLASDHLSLERRVVAQALVAPGVVVEATDRA